MRRASAADHAPARSAPGMPRVGRGGWVSAAEAPGRAEGLLPSASAGLFPKQLQSGPRAGSPFPQPNRGCRSRHRLSGVAQNRSVTSPDASTTKPLQLILRGNTFLRLTRTSTLSQQKRIVLINF